MKGLEGGVVAAGHGGAADCVEELRHVGFVLGAGQHHFLGVRPVLADLLQVEGGTGAAQALHEPHILQVDNLLHPLACPLVQAPPLPPLPLPQRPPSPPPPYVVDPHQQRPILSFYLSVPHFFQLGFFGVVDQDGGGAGFEERPVLGADCLQVRLVVGVVFLQLFPPGEAVRGQVAHQ